MHVVAFHREYDRIHGGPKQGRHRLDPNARRTWDRPLSARGCAQGGRNERGNRAPQILKNCCLIVQNGAIQPLARSWPQGLDHAYAICYKGSMIGTDGAVKGVFRFPELEYSVTFAGIIDPAPEEDERSRARRASRAFPSSPGGGRSTRVCKSSATMPMPTSCRRSGTSID